MTAAIGQQGRVARGGVARGGGVTRGGATRVDAGHGGGTPAAPLKHAQARVITVALAGLAVAFLALTPPSHTPSGATFNASATASGSFSVTTLSLGASPSSALLVASGLQPGAVVVGQLWLANGGGTPLRYSMTSSATNADGKGLAAVLNLRVLELGSSCAAGDGAELYNGPLLGASLGSTAPGWQLGDRTISASSGEALCFRAALSQLAPTSYGGAATTASFTFTAEQTANNP